MRKLTAGELGTLPERDDVYVPEDLVEYCALADHYREVRAALDGVADQWAHYFLREAEDAGPFASGKVKPWEQPETSREASLVEHPEINFLDQFPPIAHSSLLMNNLSSTNNQYIRYIGPGMAGALKHRERHGNASVGNFQEEVRYVIQGRRPNIIDPVPTGGGYQRVPILGAKTLRPVFSDRPTPNPNWEVYAGNYEGVSRPTGRDTKDVLNQARRGSTSNIRPGDRMQWDAPTPAPMKNDLVSPPPVPAKSTFSGVGPQNGVFIPYAHLIAKLETPLNQPRKVRGRTLNSRGQVQANLSPPDPDDPESILPYDPDTLIPRPGPGGKPLPMATVGYKPQALDTSKTGHRLRTDLMRGMEKNPEMYNQRRLNVLARKYGTTNHEGPGVLLEPNPITFPRGAGRRKWLPSPQDADRTELQRVARSPADSMDLHTRAVAYETAAAGKEKQAREAAQKRDWASVESHTKSAQILRNRAAVFRREANSAQPTLTRPARQQTASGGNALVPDDETGPSRTGTKRDRDQPTPISIAVRRKKLDHLYTLKAVPAGNIQISPELFEEWQGHARQAALSKGEIGSVGWTRATDSPDDRVFVEYFNGYQFAVDPKTRSFSATRAPKGGEKIAEATEPGKAGKTRGGVDKTTWRWAAVDDRKRVLFYYTPDTKTYYDMPIYSPGVVDIRRRGNPITMGGHNLAPSSVESRPPSDEESFEKSVYGSDVAAGKTLSRVNSGGEKNKWNHEGWSVPMMWSAKHGITWGLRELKDLAGKDAVLSASIQELEDDRDIIETEALKYMWFNLRNGKAFNFDDGSGVYANQMYNKKSFRTLFAAFKQMDLWMKRNPGVLRAIGMDGVKPMTMMSMDEINDFLANLSEHEYDLWYADNKEAISREHGPELSGMNQDQQLAFLNKLFQRDRGQRPLFQTKIPVRHVKNDLVRSVADRSRPDLPPEREGGKPIPAQGRGGYHTLNVNAATMWDLMKEARDYYWKYVAKDMVSKVWQAYYKKKKEFSGSEGIEHASQKVQAQAQDAFANNDVRRLTTLRSQFLKEKQAIASRASFAATTANRKIEADPGDIRAIADKLAAAIRLKGIKVMEEAQAKLVQQAREAGYSPEEAEVQGLRFINDAYRNQRKARAENVANSSVHAHLHAHSRETPTAHVDPQEVMAGIAREYDVDSPDHKDMAWIGRAIAEGDPQAIRGIALLKGEGADEATLDNVVTYHAIKHLTGLVDQMDEKKKAKALKVVAELAAEMELFRYQNVARQLLGNPPSSKPGGISRARKGKTG